MDRGFSQESTHNTPEKEEKVLLVLRKSRKAFLIEYACGFIILLLLLATYIKGLRFPSFITDLILILGIVSIGFAEISRIFLRYIISSQKISIIRGLIKQTKKNINYHPLAFVPDISLKQNRIQRILNYGTVSVESGTSSFEINEIDSPQRVMELLETLIEKTRAKR